MKRALQKGQCDFSDLLYVPLRHPAKIPKLYDWIFVDEAQDCDVAKLALVRQSLKSSGKVLAVGDRLQVRLVSFARCALGQYVRVRVYVFVCVGVCGGGSRCIVCVCV